MKTIYNEKNKGTAVIITEFLTLLAAIEYMQQKRANGYHAEFPNRTTNGYIVYAWRKEQRTK